MIPVFNYLLLCKKPLPNSDFKQKICITLIIKHIDWAYLGSSALHDIS